MTGRSLHAMPTKFVSKGQIRSHLRLHRFAGCFKLLTDQTRKSMKPTVTLFAIFLFMICIPNEVAAQAFRESEIRRLEDLERKAVMNSDSTALFNGFWSPAMVINTPANVVGNVEGTKALLR